MTNTYAKGGFTVLENQNEVKKGKIIWLEIKDLLSGAAFPLMLMLILSASVISFASYDGDVVLSIVVLVIGEILLAGAYVIFGRQNGIIAVRRSVQYAKKREVGTDDVKAIFKVGEYSPYKGIVIPLISCIPFIIIQFIECLAPNVVCGFLIKYAFCWAYYPFGLADLSQWLDFIMIIPLCAIHFGAYMWGVKHEEKKQLKIAEAQKISERTKRGSK